MARDSAGRRFRSVLERGTTAMPGVFSAITARLAERAGFEALYLSGAGVTNSLTGFPDIGLLTLTEMAQQAHYVARATRLPVIADADTGYGEIHNVARTVEELEITGIAGIHLEDQVAPKRCGHIDGKQVIPAFDMAQKVRAAVRARSDPDFFLIARTDSRSILGLQDAIDRANRYLDAGADGIFPESLQSLDEFAEFAQKVRAPLLANMTEFGKTPLITAAEFAAMDYAMVIFPMTAFRVMMKSAEAVYRDLRRAGTQAAYLDKMQTRTELYDLVGYEEFNQRDREIADGSQEEKQT